MTQLCHCYIHTWCFCAHVCVPKYSLLVCVMSHLCVFPGMIILREAVEKGHGCGTMSSRDARAIPTKTTSSWTEKDDTNIYPKWMRRPGPHTELQATEGCWVWERQWPPGKSTPLVTTQHSMVMFECWASKQSGLTRGFQGAYSSVHW